MPPIITAITTILSLIIQFATVLTLIFTVVKTVSKPQQTQNQRIQALEERCDIIENRLDKGDTHFRAVDESNTITHQSLLVIMDALKEIAPDNQELKKGRNDLYKYLSGKN